MYNIAWKKLQWKRPKAHHLVLHTTNQLLERYCVSWTNLLAELSAGVATSDPVSELVALIFSRPIDNYNSIHSIQL